MRYALTLLLCASFARGQTVTLPAEVKVPVGRLAAVPIAFDGDDVRWDVPPELDCFREYDPDPKKIRLRLLGYQPGKFRLLAVSAKGGKLSEFAACVVIVGDPLPVVTPNPKPTPKPDPKQPAPIPELGFRFLLIEETASRPVDLHNLLADPQLEEFFQANCAKVNGVPERRYFDKDQRITTGPKLWKDALARGVTSPGFKVPWVIVSNGVTGFEGPLPTTDPQKLIDFIKPFVPAAQVSVDDVSERFAPVEPRQQTCKACGGTGDIRYRLFKWSVCQECNGTGVTR